MVVVVVVVLVVLVEVVVLVLVMRVVVVAVVVRVVVLVAVVVRAVVRVVVAAEATATGYDVCLLCRGAKHWFPEGGTSGWCFGGREDEAHTHDKTTVINFVMAHTLSTYVTSSKSWSRTYYDHCCHHDMVIEP